MKPKFKPGDVVTYIRPADLCAKFMKAYGKGPFRFYAPVRQDSESCHLRTLDDKPLIYNKYTQNPEDPHDWWTHTTTALHKDEFLTAVHKAQKRKEKHK